MRTYRIFKISF